MSFSKSGLCEPITKAVAERGYLNPTPIQQQAIPVILAGDDLLASAQTGTGKTASFVLPVLQKLATSREQQGSPRPKYIRALVLAPTRELCVQIDDDIRDYGAYLNLTSMAMYGGIDSESQKQQLLHGIDILVATPGRLLDMAFQKAVRFEDVQVLVLDEADRMLDMGFIADINKIIERLPATRQNLLFSATLPEGVRRFAKTAITQPVEISINQPLPESRIRQWLITVDKDKKSALLSHLIKENDWQQALIFISTKHGSAKLVSQLEKRGIAADAIHGDRSQAMRTKVLDDFRNGKLRYLIATGVAARGIDIEDMSRVVNYDLPDDADDYIHRIGRTGRAGASGEAISLVSKDDFRRLCAIESRLGHIIERHDLQEFAPKKVVPVSVLNYQPKHRSAKKADTTRASNRQPASGSGSASVRTRTRKPAAGKNTRRKPV